MSSIPVFIGDFVVFIPVWYFIRLPVKVIPLIIKYPDMTGEKFLDYQKSIKDRKRELDSCDRFCKNIDVIYILLIYI